MLNLILLALFFTQVATEARAIEPPVLRAGLESEPVSLDWTRAQTSEDRFLVSFLMRGLLKYDAALKPVCDLCQDFEVSGDGKMLTFRIRPSESWSDGVRLEASHFADAFKRSLQTEVSQVEKVLVEGKSTLKLRLKGSAPFVIHQLTTSLGFPLRKEHLKGGKVLESHAQEAVLGPYLLAEWKRGSHLVLEGNPAYASERPVYRVDFRIASRATQVEMYGAGKLDLLPSPTTGDLMKIPASVRGKLQVSPYWAVRLLRLQTRKGPLADLWARKGLLHAIDRVSLMHELKTGEKPATGLVPPGIVGFRDLPLVSSDLATAADELKKGNAVGMKLTLLVADVESDRQIAQAIANRLARLKVSIDLEVRSIPQFTKQLAEGKYDLALQTWLFGTATAGDLLRSFQTGASTNSSGWTHVAYDGLLEEFQSQQQSSELSRLADQLTQILEVKEVAAIPLGYPIRPFLLGKRVRSFAVTPYGDPDLVKIRVGSAE